MANAVFEPVSILINKKQLDEALATIKILHVTYHDRAFLHQQVHFIWFYIGYKKGDWRIMTGQILPLIFAIPVSLFHRCFGLAIKAHKPE